MRGKSISRLQTMTELNEILEKFLAGQLAILSALVELFSCLLGGKVLLLRFVDHLPAANLSLKLLKSDGRASAVVSGGSFNMVGHASSFLFLPLPFSSSP